MTHSHVCLCGNRFECTIDILPLPGGVGRVRCCEWPDSVCPECLASMFAAQGKDKKAIAESVAEIPDILFAYRVRRWASQT